MSERGQDIRLPVDVVADLVAGHVNILWSQVVNDVCGCCTVCCMPCNALHQLLEMDLLDELYQVHHRRSGGESAVWDEKRSQIDRSWLDRAWTGDRFCHEESKDA